MEKRCVSFLTNELILSQVFDENPKQSSHLETPIISLESFDMLEAELRKSGILPRYGADSQFPAMRSAEAATAILRWKARARGISPDLLSFAITPLKFIQKLKRDVASNLSSDETKMQSRYFELFEEWLSEPGELNFARYLLARTQVAPSIDTLTVVLPISATAFYRGLTEFKQGT